MTARVRPCPPLATPLAAAFVAVLATAFTLPAQAERADRYKPVTIEADQPGTVDLLKQIVVFNGNVAINQGTVAINADRVEVREAADGFRSAVATSNNGRQARFKQKREGIDETLEGEADRINYDSRAGTVVLTGGAVVRRMRDGKVADEIHGSEITYENTGERFTVKGGDGNTSAANPSGRVRAVLTPPASAPADDAATPAGKP